MAISIEFEKIIDKSEADQLIDAYETRMNIIHVDDFDPSELLRRTTDMGDTNKASAA